MGDNTADVICNHLCELDRIRIGSRQWCGIPVAQSAVVASCSCCIADGCVGTCDSVSTCFAARISPREWGKSVGCKPCLYSITIKYMQCRSRGNLVESGRHRNDRGGNGRSLSNGCTRDAVAWFVAWAIFSDNVNWIPPPSVTNGCRKPVDERPLACCFGSRIASIRSGSYLRQPIWLGSRFPPFDRFVRSQRWSST